MIFTTLTQDRLAEACKVLAEAFYDEPIIGHMIPHSLPDRAAKIAFYFRWSILATGFETTDIAVSKETGNILGVALWEAPDHTEKPEAAAILPEVSKEIGELAMQKLDEYELAGEGAHPDTPHWHLVDIGTGSAARGLGVGSALLQHRLDLIDKEQGLVSLEATTKRSAGLYERLGFTPKKELAGIAAGVTVMWREPAIKNDSSADGDSAAQTITANGGTTKPTARQGS